MFKYLFITITLCLPHAMGYSFTATVNNQSSKNFFVTTFSDGLGGTGKLQGVLKSGNQKSYLFSYNNQPFPRAVIKLQKNLANRNNTIYFISLPTGYQIRGCTEIGLICTAEVKSNQHNFHIQNKV